MENNFNDINMKENVSWGTEKETNQIEKEIDSELSKLEISVDDLKQDIKEAGGEEKIQEEFTKNELLASRFEDRTNRTRSLIDALILGMSTGGLAIANTQVFPQINWDLPDDKRTGVLLISATVIGLISTTTTIIDFVKAQKRVSATNKIFK